MKRLLPLALLVIGSNALAQGCDYRPAPQQTLAGGKLAGLPLVLAGKEKLQLGLVEQPELLLHSGDLLIARYPGGHNIAHHVMTAQELGTASLGTPAQQIRLLFGDDSGATLEAREWVTSMRQAMDLCGGKASLTPYRIDGIELFAWRTSQDGKPYQVFFIPDGEQVHYLEVRGPAAFADQVLAGVHRRPPKQ
ncbi:hypothetical protein ACPA5B_28920 [Pseudomonas solani]|uniref:hypothetical protein n=1 Tax=Pseudomonas solani TaxID=2731552 RepID=UPI003C2E8A00